MLLSHDLGTTGDKAALYRDDGSFVAAATVSYPARFAEGGVAEQDPQDWWEATVEATRTVLQRADVPAEEVRAVSFSGQMMGAVLVDGQGEPVRPAIIWADTRSQPQCAELLRRIPMDDAYAITGHRLNPTYSLTKLMWVRDEEPEVWRRVRLALQAKDYVAFRLTGRPVTDPSDASSTNAYDQRRGDWSDELLEAAGIARETMPEIVPSTEVIGEVSAEAASACGLRAGMPVVIGGGDGPCAATGAGVVSPSSGAYVYLGSSSWVSLTAQEPLLDPLKRTMTFNHVVPGLFVPTATMQAGGASFDWIADVVAPEEGSERYGRLEGLAAEVDPLAEGLLFLPYLLGERSPYWNPRARGVFLGLARHHTSAHLVRAVLEGVAFNLLVGLRAFEQQGGRIDEVDAIGGGARSDLWLQILADLWGITVRRRSLVEEANALGAAVVAGVGVGAMSGFDVAPALSDVEAVFEPDPERHAVAQPHYARFLEAYKRLEPLFETA